MALWTPADISTSLWIDAADSSTVTTVSGNVSQINDKSGNGRNFSQATSGSRPVYTAGGLNGRNVMTFDGTRSLVSVSASSVWSFLHSTQSAVFAVVKFGNSSNPLDAYGLMGSLANTSSNRGYQIGYEDRTLISANNGALFSAGIAAGTRVVWHFNNSNVMFSQFDGIIPPNTPNVIGYFGDMANVTAVSRAKVSVNGGGLVGNSNYTVSPSVSAPTFTLSIGDCGNGVLPLVGYIAEIVILNTLPDTGTRRTIEGYLAHKWGLTSDLPSDHPFKIVAPTQFLTNMVSHWKLDEASGDAIDSHGSNTLAAINAPGSAAGKINTSRSFNGSNQQFSIASNASLQTGDIDFSIACWCYLSSKAARQHAFTRWDFTNNRREWRLYYSAADVGQVDRMLFAVSSNGQAGTAVNLVASSFGSPPTNTWFFCVAWHDSVANTLNIQIDNGTVDSMSHSAGVYSGISTLNIGSAFGADWWNGRVDEVSFAKRIWTSDERTDLYNNGIGLAYPFTVNEVISPRRRRSLGGYGL